MLLIVDDADLSAISRALATNLGADHVAVRNALVSSLGIAEPIADEQTVRICEVNFARLLADADVQVADGDSVLTAAVVAAPRSLRGETREEGMLAALAQELGHNRRRFDVNEEDDLALSVNFRHDGGNDFECDVAASENYNMTVWIGRGSDDERVSAILARDLGALEGLISYFDTDWIENYVSEDDEILVQGKPVFSPGIVVDGVEVDVWPGAIRYTRFDSVGTVAETQVTAIDRTVFARIEQALDALRNGWFHNAHAVLAIREIVPLD